MSIASRVRCLVCGNVLMHCTCATGPCLHSGAASLIAALRAQVEELNNELEESARLHGKGSEREAALITRATSAEAQVESLTKELANVREAAALLVGQTLQRAEKAEAERDEAKGRVAEFMDWAKGCGCWSCRNAGGCAHQESDGNVLNGGICPHWEWKKARAALAECGEGK